MPQVDPNWDPNNQAGLVWMRDCHAYVIRAINVAVLKTNNMSKAVAFEQNKDGSPPSWLDRARDTFRKHGGFDLEGLAFDTLPKVQFVTKSWLDIGEDYIKMKNGKTSPLKN